MTKDLSGLSLLDIATLRELAKGYRPREVAEARHRSHKTIESQMQRIKIKLGIETNVQWMTLLRQFPGAE
jgi:DNA-binding CsgD family transcriptional regulator